MRRLIVAPATAWLMAWLTVAATPVCADPNPTAGAPPAFPAPASPAYGDPATAKRRTLVFNGASRTYLVDGPEGPGPFPVVVLLHGATLTPERTWRQTSLPTLGERKGFIVVAPQGLGSAWNLSDARSDAPDDDVGFLKAVIGDVAARDRGDLSAVFMIGLSNGGFMAMHFACRAGGTLRAAGAVAAVLPEEEARSCRRGKPLPWLQINGDADPVIPSAGGVGLMSADASFDVFADRAGCMKAATTQVLPDRVKRDQSTVQRTVRAGCAGGATSTQYMLRGAGHHWPGPRLQPADRQGPFGGANEDVDGGSIIWAHFAAALNPPRPAGR